MAVIHMDTEIVNNLSIKLKEQFQMMDDSLQDLKKVVDSMDWMGSSKEIFENDFSIISTRTFSLFEEGETLCVMLQKEIDQWVSVDQIGRSNLASIVTIMTGIGTAIGTGVTAWWNSIARSYNEYEFLRWWKKLSKDEKISFLNEQQEKIAKDLGIDIVPLKFEDLPDRFLVDYRGIYDSDEGVIRLDVDNLNSDKPWNLIGTLAHEMRHRYQDEAVKFYNQTGNPPEGISLSDVQSWKNEFENYIKSSEDFEGYRNQGIEVDARNYQDQYVDKVIMDSPWED